MNYRNIFISSLIALVSLAGCVKENFDGSSYADEEGAIRFATSSSVDVKTKTVYGEYNLTANSWPIYWTTSDIVKVYCPQAQGDAKSEKIADYKVLNATGKSSTHSDLELANNTQALKWGESEAHEFYTFYPASRVYLTGDDGTFTVSVPREQNAVVTNTESNGVKTYRAVDMNAAVMAGYKNVNKSSIGETDSVELPFKPITTAFDIVIGAPVSVTGVTNAIESTWITSITIANKAETTSGRTPLAGGFTYNAKTGADSYKLYTNTTTSEDAQSYTVNIIFDKPVELKAGASDKLIVTAFLLPETLPDIRVIVNCRENTTSGAMSAKTATVKMSTKDASTYKGKKNTINLGNLPNPIIFSYETWMANLPDDTYVSHMSLPGTHDAGTYPSTSTLDNALAQTQYVDIENQLNSGIRVLDFRPKYLENGSFNIAHGYVTYEDRSFDYVFRMAQAWLAEHPTEFLIVQLKNEFGDDETSKTGWQANMRAKLLSISQDYRIESFDPKMTLKDARGKILFLSRDFYVGEDGNTSDHNHGTWVGGKFDFGTDNNNYSIISGYDKYWSTPVFTSATPSELGNLLNISDLYKGGFGLGLASPSEENKQDCINSTITAAYNDSNVDIWYLTFLNVSGTDLGTSKYNEYTANLINGLSQERYQRVGMIMFDWACPFVGTGTVTVTSDSGTKAEISVTNARKGYEVMKAIIDNNFRGGGPAKKTN